MMSTRCASGGNRVHVCGGWLRPEAAWCTFGAAGCAPRGVGYAPRCTTGAAGCASRAARCASRCMSRIVLRSLGECRFLYLGHRASAFFVLRSLGECILAGQKSETWEAGTPKPENHNSGKQKIRKSKNGKPENQKMENQKTRKSENEKTRKSENPEGAENRLREQKIG